MKKLEYFLPRILPWCASAPEPLVYQALVDAAIRFCEESHVVKYITDPITPTDGVPDYDLDLPAQQDLARVLRVWYGTNPYEAAVRVPLNWLVTDIGQITVYPAPSGMPGLFMYIEVATKPSRNATQFPDQLYTDWIEGVCGGAISRLCAMPDQPWSNDMNAAKGEALYLRWKSKAQFESSKGRVRRDTVTVMRPFA
jgi:hypothetical protein